MALRLPLLTVLFGLLQPSCARTGAAVSCQITNRDNTWFHGGGYNSCLRAKEADIRQAEELEREEERCDDGDRRACLNAGAMNQHADPDRAIEQFSLACEANLRDGCLAAARLACREGDTETGEAQLSRACELGAPDGCSAACDPAP